MLSTRREFLRASGALTICFALPACTQQESGVASGQALIGNRLRLRAAGRIELMLGKVELGQGIGTALAQMAAEELDVSFDRIELAAVDTRYSPDESYTFSSISVQQSGPPTRQAAATARAYLLQKAASELAVDVDRLSVLDGDIRLHGAATDLSYWQLIGNAKIDIDLGDQQALKAVNDYTIVGSSIKRIDIPGKVFGKASFLQDLRLPDMVHARVVRPPAERAVLEDLDQSSIAGLPGVLTLVRDGNFVAVIAEREGQARAAAMALRKSISWSLPGDMPHERGVYDWLKKAESRTEQVHKQSAEADESIQTESVSGVYQRPYQAHAAISPSAAIAQFDGTQLNVWSHAQGMYPLRAAIAHVLQLDIENIRCMHHEASGCYGHNGADDAACDAAALAVHYPGPPVRLQWERADETAWEPYGSAMHVEIDAVIDQDVNILGWRYDLWSCPHSSRPRSPENAGNMIYAQMQEKPLPLPPVQSIPQPNGGADRNAVPLYAFPSMDVRKHLLTDVPIRVSALRGLGAYCNVFAIESFMDELAQRAGEDPFAYRLRHLQDQRAIDLLKRLQGTSQWSQRPAGGSGEGWGLGFARFKNRSSYVGIVMRLSVDKTGGAISLQQAVAVCDAGLLINPDGASAQIEGGIVQSASWTLKEQVRFSNGRKRSLDWASYPILRFDEVPEVAVAFMDRDDQPALGVGEAAQGPTAAAIANAVFHATGQRLRRLPLTLVS